jgi:hypothetical protein
MDDDECHGPHEMDGADDDYMLDHCMRMSDFDQDRAWGDREH